VRLREVALIGAAAVVLVPLLLVLKGGEGALVTAHRHFTLHRGVFLGWSREERRAWGDERGSESRAAYLSTGSRRSSS